ncbi:MAG: tRNA (guanine(10)-N(2))-dimethyltransferase, partial [Candidatus Thorarchaeota archaeon]|nr:tRNA (guanine(10)-N(2))-dimethyltransferase [Candidatus Thorarchaeota archaeon]
MPVFYNPRMRINRDLSVLFLGAYMKDHDVKLICEPLAGSGVRSL